MKFSIAFFNFRPYEYFFLQNIQKIKLADKYFFHSERKNLREYLEKCVRICYNNMWFGFGDICHLLNKPS